MLLILAMALAACMDHGEPGPDVEAPSPEVDVARSWPCRLGDELAAEHLADGKPTFVRRVEAPCSERYEFEVLRELGIRHEWITMCVIRENGLDYQRCYEARMDAAIRSEIPDLDVRLRAIRRRVDCDAYR